MSAPAEASGGTQAWRTTLASRDDGWAREWEGGTEPAHKQACALTGHTTLHPYRQEQAHFQGEEGREEEGD